MANNNDDITIKIDVDTSDVDKSFKDMEKTAKSSGDKIAKTADKIEDAYEDVEDQLKDIQALQKRIFSNINISGLTNAMNEVINTVSKAMQQCSKEIQQAINQKGSVDIKTNITGGSNESSSSSSGGMVSGVVGATAVGATLQKDLSVIKELPKAFKDSQLSLSEFNREAKKLSNQKKVLDANTQAWEEYRQTILEATGDDIGDYANAIDQQMRVVQNCLKNASTESRKSIVDLVKNLENLQNTLNIGGQTKLSRDLDHLIQKFNKLNITSGRNSSRKNVPINEQSVATVNNLLEKTQMSLSSVRDLTTRLFNMSNTDKAIVQYGKALKTFESLKQPINNVKNALSSLGKTKVGQTFSKISKSAKQYIPQASKVVDNLTNKLENYINKVKKASSATQSSTKGMASGFKGALKSLLPIMSVISIFSTLKDSVKNAMDATEGQSMFDAVFGDSANKMDAFVQKMNQTLGLSVNGSKQFTATIAQMGRAMGMSSNSAMDMSQKMLTLAGDMSAFYNVDIAQAQEDLRSALSGSNEVKVIA